MMKKILLLLMLLSSTMLKAQDVIVMKDGSTIICKVTEIGTSEVKYKKQSNLNGPIYSILRSDIQNINYENGDRDELIIINPSAGGEKDLVLNFGTMFPIQIASPVRAKDLDVGQYVSFRLMTDIDVDGVKVIRAGAPVNGIVYKASRSSWWGTKGKLGIHLDHLVLPNGQQIPVKGDIYVTGKNRTALSVLLCLFVFWPACFICGTKAELPYGFDTMGKIGATVYFTKDGKTTIINPITEPLTTIEPLEPQKPLEPKEPIKLSSLQSIPSLPCNATLYFINGKQTYVEISKINQEKGVITCRRIFKKEKKDHTDYNYSEPYTIKESKLYKIEFEDDLNPTEEDNKDDTYHF